MRFLVILALCFYAQADLIVLEDTSDSIKYSNSGPSWTAANPRGGGGDRLGSAQNDRERFSGMNWHESYGDGASFSFTFTGTRVILTGASALKYYNTRINGYIDGELKAQYENVVSSVETTVAPLQDGYSGFNYHYAITMLDIGNLSPGQHTFRAVSVGANSLFVVDTIQYEPSDAAPSTTSAPTSSSSRTSSSSSSQTSRTIDTQSVNSTTSSQSTTRSSSSSSSHSSISTSTSSSSSEPAISLMDVKPSDSRIIYFPTDAWSANSDRRRAESCLTGTMSSTTPGSSLSFNFTGSALQLYTIASENGGRYSVTLDGQPRGTFDTHADTTQPSQCSLSAQFTIQDLDSSEHSLVMKVEGPSSGSNQTTLQFVGFRLSSSSISPAVSNPQTETHSKPPLGPIIGGVVGALALLAITACALYFLKKQRKQDHHQEHDPNTPDSYFVASFGVEPMSTSGGKRSMPFGGHKKPHLFETASDSTVSHDHALPVAQSGSSHEDSSSNSDNLLPQPPSSQTYSQPRPLWANPVTPSQYSQSHTQAINTPYPNTAAVDPETASNADRATYYTLPSYHERVLEGAGRRGRELSEADVDAISRRLREVMRQSGHMPLEPPRELVDHLVEQQLGPR
ncbi:SubName: Full=Uncharacterized protein {ECO:0000313/EMBL:CCA73943.1} [Serendipita indica DSM 11827]|nr:SubName: Full=Uncharacterized protein {ECO:0000313/EMBL:CCA73943.1} [Serendipita indica DSM 11827]